MRNANENRGRDILIGFSQRLERRNIFR
jgi:hypothetical protein